MSVFCRWKGDESLGRRERTTVASFQDGTLPWIVPFYIALKLVCVIDCGGSDGKEFACNVGDLGDLGWEDPLEEGKATHCSMLAWRIRIDRGTWQAAVHRFTESDTTEQLSSAQHRNGVRLLLKLGYKGHSGLCLVLSLSDTSLWGEPTTLW